MDGNNFSQQPLVQTTIFCWGDFAKKARMNCCTNQTVILREELPGSVEGLRRLWVANRWWICQETESKCCNKCDHNSSCLHLQLSLKHKSWPMLHVNQHGTSGEHLTIDTKSEAKSDVRDKFGVITGGENDVVTMRGLKITLLDTMWSDEFASGYRSGCRSCIKRSDQGQDCFREQCRKRVRCFVGPDTSF